MIDITLENLSPGQDGSTARQLKDMVRHLRRLLGTVFDSARLNEGMVQADIRPTSLAPIFRDLNDLMADSSGNSDVTVKIDQGTGNLKVMADPSLLSRVLQNLLFNAVQHSGGNRIHLSARSVDTQVLLEVSDNGTGVPPELNDSLFSPYVRGQGQTDYPGLGLGLTIVKEFVVLMQGTCGVEIETGRGSVFWVRLPAALTANRVHEPDSRTPSGYEHQAG